MKQMLGCIERELRLQSKVLGHTPIHTLYIGGGTPSILDIDALKRLFSVLHKHYSLEALSECTIEANPEDVNEKQLVSWQEIGINRLSIGIQSFHQPYLDIMGRRSSRATNISACRVARASGIRYISIDLIYGIVSGGMKIWEKDIDTAVSLDVDHLSAYSLTVEPKTVLAYRQQRGLYVPPSNDEVADELDLLYQKASASGFRHYEVSSFARPDAEALHNSNYWRGDKYLGVGPSAHSYDGDKRWRNLRQHTLYIRRLLANQLPTEEVEQLNRSTRWWELLSTTLRTREGLPLSRAEALLGSRYPSFEEKLAPLLEQSLLQKTSTHLSPTYEGLKVADSIALYLF